MGVPAAQPVEDCLRRRPETRRLGRDPEIHQRDETPVSAGPFCVGVDAEPPVLSLARQQPRNQRSSGDRGPGGPDVRVSRRAVEEIAQGSVPDCRLVRGEQQLEGGVRGLRGRLQRCRSPGHSVICIQQPSPPEPYES